jgi:hypothetical protein
MNSKKQILELVAKPLEEIFGELPTGIVNWMLQALLPYSDERLIQITRHVIHNSEWSPKPATIIKAVNETRPKLSNVVVL